MSKVKITSTVPYTISWYYPEQRINNLFTPKKPVFFVEEEVLKELLFYPGARGCFENGSLYIEDDAARIRVGLGSENPEEDKIIKPVILSEGDMERLLTTAKYADFKVEIENLPSAQLDILVGYAIEHKKTDYAKCNLLKKMTGRDIVEIVKLNAEEELSEE